MGGGVKQGEGGRKGKKRERGKENSIHIPDCSQSSLAIRQHQASVEILHELSPDSFPEE